MLPCKASSYIQRRFVISPAWKKSLFLWLIYFISVGLGRKDGVRATPSSWLWILDLSRVWRASVNFGHLASLRSMGNTVQRLHVPGKYLLWDNPLIYGPHYSQVSDLRMKILKSLAGPVKGKTTLGPLGTMRSVHVDRILHSLCIFFTLTFPALTHWWAHKRHSISKYHMEGRTQ